MKLHKIGLITGLSPKASFVYGQKINQLVNRRLGGLTSAPMVINSIDLATISAAIDVGNWGKILTLIGNAADEAYLANAEALVICSNTLHGVAPMLSARHHTMPIIHIGDTITQAVKESQLRRVGLLGTEEVIMNQCAILDRLHYSGATIYRPDAKDMQDLDHVIVHNLYKSENMTASRAVIARTIQHLVEQVQIQGIVFGSTELEGCFTKTHQDTLRQQLKLPDFQFFKSMSLHVDAAAEFVCTGSIPQSALKGRGE